MLTVSGTRPTTFGCRTSVRTERERAAGTSHAAPGDSAGSPDRELPHMLKREPMKAEWLKRRVHSGDAIKRGHDQQGRVPRLNTFRTRRYGVILPVVVAP